MRGVTQMMEYFREHYGKNYAPNTRETVRRQTVHQFLDAGLIVANPDNLYRAINSAQTVYRLEQGTLELLRTYGTAAWDKNLAAYLASVQTLKERYAQEKEMARIPVTIARETPITLTLSPGGPRYLHMTRS